MTTLRSVPISGTCTSTVSPLRKYFGGSKRAPAPVGVPVAIRSPGVSRMKLERYSMRRANGKIRLAVVSARRAHEHGRILRRCGSVLVLGVAVAVVDADADDLLGIADRR